jgi:hypothetical protein
MTGSNPAARRKAFFCFADPVGYSGQKAAVEIVMRGLSTRGWEIHRLPLPVLERSNRMLAALPRYLLGLALSWIRLSRLLPARGSWLCLGMGQTRASFVRDMVPLLLGRVFLGRERVVVTLNGSLFMNWPVGSPDARIFRFLIENAGSITVVGEGQKRRMAELGVRDARVHVLVNTCELEPMSAADVASKHHRNADPSRPVNLLHLGSLVDTKGFPEFLEALCRIEKLAGPKIDAVLCGPLAASEYSIRFASLKAAEDWIEARLAAINRSSRARARWIKGAAGEEKLRLFRHAEVFVLPTRYAVEAQPLVLLEAMASGCAIVTTRAGEISTILDERSAVFLGQCTTGALAPILQSLVADAATRARLGRTSNERFITCYGIERHLDAWELLMGAAPKPIGGVR